jgi:hypothetical protein
MGEANQELYLLDRRDDEERYRFIAPLDISSQC